MGSLVSVALNTGYDICRGIREARDSRGSLREPTLPGLSTFDDEAHLRVAIIINAALVRGANHDYP